MTKVLVIGASSQIAMHADHAGQRPGCGLDPSAVQSSHGTRSTFREGPLGVTN
uniref:hypothetical protein n=1 Tax=Lactobacillus equicursoris TaxID=420645 RepID=UPI0012DE43A7|nr:hypothetical protein [Lactobacillus equicursoris]